MYIYNITLKTDWSVHEAWLAWMKQHYIPQAMESGCFTRFQLVRLLQVDEKEGPTYALQLYADSKADYNRYTEVYLPRAEAGGYQKWGNGVLSFSSLMEVVI